eukprot:GEZU01016254.1.p1 GENE.GEZU01016254.1~~GEZU01016254.1.p1  ORF type:complete len:118 (-),score=10.15 GEZU01016254.1:831-1184(-)
MNTNKKGVMAGLVGAYFVLVNAGSAALFWYDKQQAINGGWRVRERDLQLTALAGGWIGGFWAMQAFRHKRSKPEFLQPYYAACAANLVILGALFSRSKNMQQILNTAMRNINNKRRF